MKLTQKKKIINAWKRVKQKHPSYTEIAEKTGSHKSYVARIIQDYKRDNKIKV